MQVKFSTIGKKVQFTILLENSEQDVRLLMNDLSNLLKRKNVWRGGVYSIYKQTSNFKR